MASSSSENFITFRKHLLQARDRRVKNVLTINDDTMLKPGFARIAYQEEDINVANEPYLAGPSFIINENIPWVDVAICWLLRTIAINK